MKAAELSRVCDREQVKAGKSAGEEECGQFRLGEVVTRATGAPDTQRAKISTSKGHEVLDINL